MNQNKPKKITSLFLICLSVLLILSACSLKNMNSEEALRGFFTAYQEKDSKTTTSYLDSRVLLDADLLKTNLHKDFDPSQYADIDHLVDTQIEKASQFSYQVLSVEEKDNSAQITLEMTYFDLSQCLAESIAEVQAANPDPGKAATLDMENQVFKVLQEKTTQWDVTITKEVVVHLFKKDGHWIITADQNDALWEALSANLIAS